MDKRKQTLYQTMLARISLGAVPVDGIYWFDPREAKKTGAQHERSHNRDEISQKRATSTGGEDSAAAEGSGRATLPSTCC